MNKLKVLNSIFYYMLVGSMLLSVGGLLAIALLYHP
jgi:hypothetical protein